MEKLLKWIGKHKLLSISSILVLFLAPILVIHILFKFEACSEFWAAEWSAGEMINYIGSFYAFIGTSILSIMALWQNFSFRKEGQKNARYQAELSAEPIFIFELNGIDVHIPNTVDGFNFTTGETLARKKNFSLKITNAGKEAVFNVIIFNRYVLSHLDAKQSHTIYCAFDAELDENSYKQLLLPVAIEEFPKDEESHYPKEITINYDDIFGNSKFQLFDLFHFEETLYYSRNTKDE